MDRREFLKFSAQSGKMMGIATFLSSIGINCSNPKLNTDVDEIGVTTLRNRAETKGLLFGTALRPHHLRNEAYRTAIINDCSIIVPEVDLKWSHIQGHGPDNIDMTSANALLEFATENNMKFRGHALLWYKRLPFWVSLLLNEKKDPKQILKKHIDEVAGYFSGKMHSWDVVNEVIEPKDGRSDGLRETPFLKAMGPSYISEAFKMTAKADPNSLLTLNEYGLEWSSPHGHYRRVYTLRLLEKLLKEEVPIHCLGIQAHLRPEKKDYMNKPALKAFCREVENLGLKIIVTELDARDTFVYGNHESRDRAVAKAYYDFLDVILDTSATIAILTWGLSDDVSWLNQRFPRKDGSVVRGTLYNTDIKRKLAWFAVASAFDKTHVR